MVSKKIQKCLYWYHKNRLETYNAIMVSEFLERILKVSIQQEDIIILKLYASIGNYKETVARLQHCWTV
jgi:hypothetical protein